MLSSGRHDRQVLIHPLNRVNSKSCSEPYTFTAFATGCKTCAKPG